jgi:hypothetical protein
MLRGHSHGWEHWWRGCRPVWGAGWTRIVLATTPRQPDPRIADRIALHLVDCHLCSMSLHKLNKTTAFARGNFDISDLAKSLEEGTKFVFGDIAREPADKDSRVVWISKLIHRLRSAIVPHWGSSHGIHSHGRLTGQSGSGTGCSTFGSSGRDAHGPVAAVNALHLSQGTMLILFVREPDKAVATRHSANRIRHNLGGLARREPGLKKRDKHVFVHFGSKIPDKDGIFGSTIIAGRVMA